MGVARCRERRRPRLGHCGNRVGRDAPRRQQTDILGDCSRGARRHCHRRTFGRLATRANKRGIAARIVAIVRHHRVQLDDGRPPRGFECSGVLQCLAVLVVVALEMVVVPCSHAGGSLSLMPARIVSPCTAAAVNPGAAPRSWVRSDAAYRDAFPNRPCPTDSKWPLPMVTRTRWTRRVEMWRGGSRFGLSVSAPFVWRCPSNLAVAPFPHPAHRTGHADLPHPALGQDITPSPTPGRGRVRSDVRARSARRGARVDRPRPCVH